DQVQRRVARRNGGRDASFRDHHEPVGYFKQFVELFRYEQDGATCVPQGKQLRPYLGCGADVYTPRRLGNQQYPWPACDFTPDDVLLEIAAGQAAGRRLWPVSLHTEA